MFYTSLYIIVFLLVSLYLFIFLNFSNYFKLLICFEAVGLVFIGLFLIFNYNSFDLTFFILIFVIISTVDVVMRNCLYSIL